MDTNQDAHLQSAPHSYILSAADERRALAISSELHARLEARPGTHRNNPSTLRLAKIGEVGASKWLRSCGAVPIEQFADLNQIVQAGLVVNGVRIEVRSWSVKHWNEMGRSVDPDKLPVMQRTTDVVLWATLDNSTGSTLFQARGWSQPVDLSLAPFRVVGPPWNKIKVHQLTENRMRSVAALLVALTKKS